ncbi:hypothetical protein HYPSUDRAFT_210332 [Hypholoma sublateritium FD-334 SS-4]|uniref:Uncharacterized protein n=1 Tax=Hypholoma sublateritium (strain FD-334 SS-4) TaxID=945553 RepID=A0A0D2N715_HYPSF|nr:hypothetical protein HYPSUDRAFT_210332 [Hypholoma sublateritium FD-334 SS-4]
MARARARQLPAAPHQRAARPILSFPPPPLPTARPPPSPPTTAAAAKPPTAVAPSSVHERRHPERAHYRLPPPVQPAARCCLLNDARGTSPRCHVTTRNAP